MTGGIMHHTVALPGFIRAVEPFLHHYGYLAIFFGVLLEDFGLPLPGETIVLTASILAGQRVFNIVDVIITASFGGIVGDTLGYFLGLRFGHRLLIRFARYVGLRQEWLRRFNHWILHRGVWLVVIARFIDGLRQLNGWIAGANGIIWTRFIPLNMLGAVLWVSAWALSGYFFSGKILAVMERFKQVDVFFVILGGLGILTPVALHYFRRLRGRSRPSTLKDNS
ncbi:hypothetical protein BFX06_03555 [Sulfobacillus thermosulfidooxidans]|nr:hypothetical protein BFX06_03555 [Sulfobacillus thermosulfidooxidans]OLZ18037.1 hypothetical protein BFX07_06575 [Sulfobacillus thermosulfidooxidans]